MLKTEDVPERGLTSALYRHKQTGAEVLSIDADDENNVFSANFKTLPTDDTGVPHILERERDGDSTHRPVPCRPVPCRPLCR